MLCSKIAKRRGHLKKCQIIPLPLDSISSSVFNIPNCKRLYLCIYWWQPQKTINAKVFIANVCTITSLYHGESSRNRWTKRSMGWRKWYYNQWLNMKKYSSIPNQKYYLSIQIYVWVWVLHIFQKYTFMIIIRAWVF